MSNNDFMSVWLLAIPMASDSNSQDLRYMWVQGQSESASLLIEETKTAADLNLGNFRNLIPESVFIGRVIIKYTAGNWRIEEVLDISGTRFSQTSAPAGNYLSVVNTDTTLTGDGTSTNALGLNLASNNTFTGTIAASNLTGTNTGDQTSIAGITGTTAQFNTALTDGSFATGGGTATGTNTGDQTTVTGKSGSTDALNSATTTVNVSSATAPTTGQVLTATSSTAATWQDAGGGGGDLVKFARAGSQYTGSNVTAVGFTGLQVDRFADGVIGEQNYVVSVPTGATGISSVEILYRDLSSSALNIYLAFSFKVGSDAATFQTDAEALATYASNGTSNEQGVVTVPSTGYNGLTVSGGDTIGVELKRDASNAADTYGTVFDVIGVRFTFS